MDDLEKTIETRLAELDPELELVMLDRPAAEKLRLYVDRPGGVDLDVCEQVSAALRDLLDSYSVEVSSPGLDRPLTKPEHFKRFLGHRVRVRTREPIAGQRNFSGELVAVDESQVSLRSDADEQAIPLTAIHRSNLISQEVAP